KLTDENDEEAVLDTREYLMELAEDMLDALVDTYASRSADFEEWDLDGLRRETNRVFGIDSGSLTFDNLTSDEIRDLLWTNILASYESKEKIVPQEILRRVERDIMLQIVDQQWKDHLYSLDHLKEGIGLRGYGQRDPLIEYKKESFALFQAMKERVDEEIVRYLWWLRPVEGEEAAVQAPRRPAPRRAPLILNDPSAESASASALTGPRARSESSPFGAPRQEAPRQQQQPARVGGDDAKVVTVRRDEPKVGRNDPCPCGSGKKYKKCHGAAA
ncbi:MAG TPA: SEC-C metal-binding domain-containing protein, partial [Vicinamibacterales bacterium]